ncbi:hypothetical protein Bca52824_032937 [Brassica carinata]|uniref:Leucine-rich repeat-containing N-terminal plant-type domain-containing protein n=1 Tax=Brassica carinata TaxID=52824 RepID=A0A8X7SDB0_BRACI|nr:hypothetical protein Bca52824_032937 [Brassica carinata]
MLSVERSRVRRVFDGITLRNVVSWTSMIAGYVKNGLKEEGLAVFNRMKGNYVLGNEVTYGTLVSDLHQGKWLHGGALLQLRDSLKDSSNRLRWTRDFVSPCFSWSYVTCRDQNVVALSLASNGFTGTLSPSITKLKFLVKLVTEQQFIWYFTGLSREQSLLDIGELTP